MKESKWWQGATSYQVYLRSFQDSNGDGIGDIPGLISRLDYIEALDVEALWITPPYPSPMKDFGYDVENYKDIDPVFGTLEDFKTLVAEADKRGIKIILDHVWSHSSDQHPWFIASADPDHPDHEKYKDYYVWANSNPDGSPPNNWQSVFNGSAWKWHEKREQWYLHNFLEEQPDLNWHNPDLRREIEDVARFWLDLGVAGFRLDVCNFYAHDASLRDDPLRPNAGDQLSFGTLYHTQSINRPETVQYIRELRTNLAADYPDVFLLGEIAAMEGGLHAAASYIDPGNCLDSIYSNYLVHPRYPSASELGELLTQIKEELDGGGSVYWVLGTHDFKRVASRWLDPERQKDLLIQANALLLSLPGIAGLYQGDELGLPDAPVSFETMQDPQGIRYNDIEMSRDGCRAPHIWEERDISPTMGFTEAA